MTPAEADHLIDSPAAYVHIPFCSAICPYCDFAVVAGRDDQVDRYVDAVVKEIGRSEMWRPLGSVYFGGGTPSRVDPALLGTILDALAAKHGIDGDAEISMEANPEDFTTSLAHRARAVGFNRVSFGAQSFDQRVLGSLGRRHDSEQIHFAVDSARSGGFENVSVDLIYGTPIETDQSWATSLGRVSSLGVEHVSCYSLTVERGTELWRSVEGGAAAPDPDIQADRFEMAEGFLGHHRYEVSNWAIPGRECRYNMTVWAQGEYEAYGNGAHGFRNHERFHNARRLDTYFDRVESGVSARMGVEHLAGWESEIDRLFVGLRRAVGVAWGPGTAALMASDDGVFFQEAGVIDVAVDRLRIIEPLLTDAVCRSVLALKPPIVSVTADA